MEAGASVFGCSGGFGAAWRVRIRILMDVAMQATGAFFLLLLTLDAGGVQAMGGGAEARGN